MWLQGLWQWYDVIVVTLLIVVASLLFIAERRRWARMGFGDQRSVVLHRLITSMGKSMWIDDVHVPLGSGGEIGLLSRTYGVNGLRLRETPGSYNFAAHCAPRRQLIVMLDAGVEVTDGLGITRRIGAGELLYVEDTSGEGHVSRAIENSTRHSLFLHLDDDEYFDAPPMAEYN